MKRWYIYVLFEILAAFLPNEMFAELFPEAQEEYRVLCIQSSGNPTVEKKRRLLVEEAFSKADILVNLNYVFLRTHDVQVESIRELLKENLDTYRDTPPDVILAFNDDALRYLIQSEHPVACQTPIVFSNVILPADTLDKYPLITGQLETIDYRQAYELGVQLFGEVDELQIACGFQKEEYLLIDTAWKQLMEIPECAFIRNLNQSGPEGARIDTIRNPDTISRPLTVAFDLPTVWEYGQFCQYYENDTPIRHFGIKALGEHIYVDFLDYQLHPFIGVANAYFSDEGFSDIVPHGVIGGYFNRVEVQTNKAVKTALRILKGEPAESIPVDTGLRTPVFDWKVMQHWGISESRLPDGSVVVNKPFMRKYKKVFIVGSIFGCVLIILLIIYLARITRNANFKHTSSQKKLDEEQERMQTMINTISDFIISMDCQGMIVSVNPAARRFLRLEQKDEELNKIHFCSLVKLSPRYKHDAFWLQKLVDRSVETHERECLPEGSLLELYDGRSLQISGSVQALYVNGEHVGTLLTFRDCTDKLREEQFLEFCLEAGDVYTWQVDMKKKQITFHDSFFATNGINRDVPTLSKEEFIDMLHPDDYDQNGDGLRRLLLNPDVNKSKIQLRMKLPVGYVWYEFRIASMPGRINNPEDIHLFGICLSIQKQKETESDMQKVLEQAEDSNRVKSEFLANMSHEIRTPLNAIVGFSTIINEVEEEERGKFLKLISENCDMLLQTINGILDISRVESGYPFQYKICYLKKFLSELWSEELPRFEESDVEFFLEMPEEECVMEIDLFRLKQLLVQLIKNGRNFTLKGSVTLGYQYKIGRNSVTIYVRDTGIGIAPEDRKNVFERFYKLDKFTSGGGLGLSLCMEITQRFNGTIQITDGLHGKGTCVFVELPIHQVLQ